MLTLYVKVKNVAVESANRGRYGLKNCTLPKRYSISDSFRVEKAKIKAMGEKLN